MTFILLLALLLEWGLGDPQSRFHPVALFGRWVSWCESFLYGGSRLRGFMAYLYVLAIPFALLWFLHDQIGWPFDVLLVWLSIGWKSLFEHVQAVLGSASVSESRDAIAKIVSRDTALMSEEDARRAALESLAENASDAVIAPLFWFVLLGPLGAILYRMVNTLDAMWGYRNPRYHAFGFCAAKVDDVANWVPARITARLMLLVGRSTDWETVREQASTHSSPNAGWPEVALAYAADVKLGGPVQRDGVVDERPFYGEADARAVNPAAAFDALLVVRNSLLMAAGVVLVISFAL